MQSVQLQVVENLVQNLAAVEYFRKICRPKTLSYLPSLSWLQPASALCNVGMAFNHFLHPLLKYFFSVSSQTHILNLFMEGSRESLL